MIARSAVPTADPRYKHRVLVVDDYPDAAEATCMLFTRLGHCCRQATDGTREEIRTDDLGRFAFVAVAARRIRVAVRPDAGAALVTPWLAL